MRGRREDLPLGFADQQAVLRLVADQAVVVHERRQRGDLPAGQVADTDVGRPPRLQRVGEEPRDLRQRRGPVRTVDLVEVDVGQPEPLQARVERATEVRGAQARCRADRARRTGPWSRSGTVAPRRVGGQPPPTISSGRRPRRRRPCRPARRPRRRTCRGCGGPPRRRSPARTSWCPARWPRRRSGGTQGVRAHDRSPLLMKGARSSPAPPARPATRSSRAADPARRRAPRAAPVPLPGPSGTSAVRRW